MALIKDNIFAETRYLTYYVIFPDQDTWHQQYMFTGPISNFIKNTALYKKDPSIARNMLLKGSHHWKDKNGVTHRVVIEDKPRADRWGTGKSKQIIL